MAWAHVSTRRCTVAAFSDERSSGKDTRKSADAQKVKIASKMSAQPIVFVFFSPEFFCLIFPCRTVQKRHFSAIISGTWADFPQRLRLTLPIRGMGPLSTISAMKNGATVLRNRKSIFTKQMFDFSQSNGSQGAPDAWCGLDAARRQLRRLHATVQSNPA